MVNDSADGPSRGDDHSLDPELESLLGELVRDWNSGTPRPLRAYLGRRPGLIGRPEVMIELIHQEVVLRQMRGETPRPADYLSEFPELSDSVERLFELHDLGSGPVATADETMVLSPSFEPGAARRGGGRLPEISGYEIERFLGRGGMGMVYLARHLDLNRKVALKLLQESRQDDPGHIARFRREAEAAARCQHPNLVQIHDVGEHDGQVYLALEYVAGGHLGRALAGEPQPPRQAAELVETLARAIDHAHAQGVIHRDLKPANVLLAPDGQPKITDFGLAKLRDSTTDTEVGTVLGTLAYMSPEQVRAESGEIGPLTDIHALGTILYEALTGRPPYRAETPQRVLHAILTEEIVAPSARQPGLPRDLEAICLKCLDKEPSRRYATAADLAEDLRRFLDGRPTAARPASAAERGVRWCRRNRWAVAAIAALMLTTTVSAWQAVRATMAERTARAESRRAEDESEIARAVNEFLTQDILNRAWTGIPPQIDTSLSTDLKVRTALDLAAEKIGERFKDRPLIEAAIRSSLGQAYCELAQFPKAAPQFERALALRGRVLGDEDPQTLITRRWLGVALVNDRPVEAGRHLERAMRGLLAAKGGADPDGLIAMQGVGAALLKQGKYMEAEPLIRQALTGLRVARGPVHPDTLDAAGDLILAMQSQKKLEEARSLVMESIRIASEGPDRENAATLDAKFRMALFLHPLGDLQGSIRLLEEILPAQQRLLGDGHYGTLLTMAMLSQYYIYARRWEEAEALLLKALPECRKDFDRNHPVTNLVVANLTTCHSAKNDIKKVAQYAVEARDMRFALNGPEDVFSDVADDFIITLYLYLLPDERAAERYVREHLDYTIRHDPESPRRYLAEGQFGLCLLLRKARAEGDALLKRAYDWTMPRIYSLQPADRGRFRMFEGEVSKFYESEGDRAQADIWKARLLDFGFPTSKDEIFSRN